MKTKEKIIDLFYEIASIPHTSGNTNRIIQYLKKFAQQNHLKSKEINGNLLITIPSSSDMQDKNPIIIQGHCDMVGVKEKDLKFDFLNDSIEIKIDKDKNFMTANQTTLGADDGIALVYMMLLIQERNTFKHPKIYCVITRDEEIGLLGAKEFDFNEIKDADYVLNLDTEAEGLFVISSSGGEEIKGTYKYEMNLCLGTVYELSVDGLTGGHSGGNTLGLNGAQASRLIAQTLGHLIQMYQLQLISIDCSGLNNVITNEGKALFISNAPSQQLINSALDILKLYASCYALTDPKINMNLKIVNHADKLQAFTRQSTGNILFNIMYVPYGIFNSYKGFPLASVNMGSCIAGNGVLEIKEHVRFADNNFGNLLKNRIIQYFTLTGATFEVSKHDPPWIKKVNSKLQQIATKVWSDLGYNNPQFVDMHATLETGLFNEKLPNAEIISFGPNIEKIHTPKEKLDLNSSVRIYKYLKKIIESLN